LDGSAALAIEILGGAMKDFSRIMVVSRMTRHCRMAVHYGLSLARKYDAELSIIHVIHNPFGLEGWNLPMVSLAKDYENLVKEAKADLDDVLRKERAGGLNVRELIRDGDPVEEVIKAVEEEQIDLLVMLAHEEWHLEHFLFGRSNAELVRRMPCSIMFVKKEPQPVDW